MSLKYLFSKSNGSKHFSLKEEMRELVFIVIIQFDVFPLYRSVFVIIHPLASSSPFFRSFYYYSIPNTECAVLLSVVPLDRISLLLCFFFFLSFRFHFAFEFVLLSFVFASRKHKEQQKIIHKSHIPRIY